MVSFAVGVSSLSFGMNYKIFGFPRGILSFTTALGFGSLVMSLYFLKGVSIDIYKLQIEVFYYLITL